MATRTPGAMISFAASVRSKPASMPNWHSWHKLPAKRAATAWFSNGTLPASFPGMPRTSWTVGAACLLFACGGKTDEPSRVTEPVACHGAITSSPSLLLSGLPSGRLRVAGDDVILAGDDGTIVRIDRCSGASSLVASDVAVTSFDVTADYVWFVRSDSEPGLFKVPISGGAVEEVVAGTTGYPLRAHDSTLYLTRSGAHGIDVHALEIEHEELALVATLPTRPLHHLSLAAVSDAGLYFHSYCDDYGCAPTLHRLPFGSAELLPVRGASGNPGGFDDYAVAVGGSQLFIKAGIEIARLPLTGGEREVLVADEPENGRHEQFGASDRGAVCWMAWEESSVALRCLGVADSEQKRELDRFQPAGTTSLELAPDAVYWLRPSRDTAHELVAAAL